MTDKSNFDLFDADADGYLTAAELHLALYSMGCNPTQQEAAALAAQLPNPEQISFAQFQQLLAQAPRPDNHAEQHLLEAFRVFDKNEDGFIPENDLRVIFTTLGETVELQEMNYLLSQVKVNENGKVKYADFVKIMLK